MSRIFVCYRREDSAGHAGRIVDSLERRFGKHQVFLDVDTVAPGSDFVEAIKSALDSCFAFVAVIGKHWLDIATEDGRRRLDDPEDFIRRELSYALEHDVRVVPVLVQRTPMPAAENLPEDLRPLTRIQALNLSDERWDYDMDRMMEVLKGIAGRPKRTRLLALGLAIVIALCATYWLVRAVLETDGPTATSTSSTSPPSLPAVPGFYLGESVGTGEMITASNLRAVEPSRVEATVGDFIEWCAQGDLPSGHHLGYEDVDFCPPGYYSRYPAAAGQRLILENLIEVGPLSEAPDIGDLVSRCFVREVAAGRTLAPADLGDC